MVQQNWPIQSFYRTCFHSQISFDENGFSFSLLLSKSQLIIRSQILTIIHSFMFCFFLFNGTVKCDLWACYTFKLSTVNEITIGNLMLMISGRSPLSFHSNSMHFPLIRAFFCRCSMLSLFVWISSVSLHFIFIISDVMAQANKLWQPINTLYFEWCYMEICIFTVRFTNLMCSKQVLIAHLLTVKFNFIEFMIARICKHQSSIWYSPFRTFNIPNITFHANLTHKKKRK